MRMANSMPVANFAVRRGADRVVVTLLVQHARLPPDHGRQRRPAELLIASSRVYGGEKGLVSKGIG